MPSTFLAPALPRFGESFLLLTGNKAVLVDTGWRVSDYDGWRGLAAYMRSNFPQLTKIDRLILTHEDADHCDGAPQFIGQWLSAGCSIDEIWLPAMWAPAAATAPREQWVRNAIVKGAFQAAPSIAKRAQQLKEQRDPGKSGSQADRQLQDEQSEALRDVADETWELSELFEPILEESGRAKTLDRLELADADFAEASTSDFGMYDDNFDTAVEIAHDLGKSVDLPSAGAFANVALRMAGDALDTHGRIAETVASCVYFDVPIRWFDFGQYEKCRVAAGGDNGFLTPVNSVEVKLKARPVLPVAMFLALSLSRANRECLAFLRHEDGVEPAVLFTGDSRLSTRNNDFRAPIAGLPVARNILVTAMHHGSSHNERGYRVLRNWLKGRYPPLFVRSGGYRVSSPTISYLQPHTRVCVRCINSARPEVSVQVESHGGRWRMPNHPALCECS